MINLTCNILDGFNAARFGSQMMNNSDTDGSVDAFITKGSSAAIRFDSLMIALPANVQQVATPIAANL